MKNRYHHKNLKEKLLKEAILIVKKEGVNSLTFRKLAKNLGISHSAPLRHFKNKEHILASIAEIGFIKLINLYKEKIKNINEPLEKLKIYGETYINFAVQHIEYFQIMFTEPELDKSKYPELKDLSIKSLSIITELIKEGQQKNIFKNSNPVQLAASCWCMVHGFALLIIDNRLQSINMLPEDFDFNLLQSGIFEDLKHGLLKK